MVIGVADELPQLGDGAVLHSNSDSLVAGFGEMTNGDKGRSSLETAGRSTRLSHTCGTVVKKVGVGAGVVADGEDIVGTVGVDIVGTVEVCIVGTVGTVGVGIVGVETVTVGMCVTNGVGMKVAGTVVKDVPGGGKKVVTVP